MAKLTGLSYEDRQGHTIHWFSFFFRYRNILVICATLNLFFIGIAFLLNKWKKYTENRRNKTTRWGTDASANCAALANKLKMRLQQHEKFQKSRKQNLSTLLQNVPKFSFADYKPPDLDYTTQMYNENDETLNEITWGIDSTVSVYRPNSIHITTKFDNFPKNVSQPEETNAKVFLTNKHETKKRPAKPTEQVRTEQRQKQTRKEMNRQTRPKTTSLIPRLHTRNTKSNLNMQRRRSNTSLARIQYRNAKSKIAPKSTTQDVKKLALPLSKNPKIKARRTVRPFGWMDKTEVAINTKKAEPITSGLKSKTADLMEGQDSFLKGGANLVSKKDSWIWFPKESRSNTETFASRHSKFMSADPRVKRLAEEIERQEKMNRDIERNARNLIESSSMSSDPKELLGFKFSSGDILEGSCDRLIKGYDFNNDECEGVNVSIERYKTHESNLTSRRECQNTKEKANISSAMKYLNQIKENLKSFNSDIKDETISSVRYIPTKPGSPQKLMKGFHKYSVPSEQHFNTNNEEISTSSNDEIVMKKRDAHFDRILNSVDGLKNGPRITMNGNYEKPTESIILQSVDDDPRRFWPRSISANVAGQEPEDRDEMIGANIKPSSISSLKLAMTVSPSPSRLMKNRSNISSTGRNSLRYSSNTVDSETNSLNTKLLKIDHSRVESLIKTEVKGVVRNLFKSPCDSSISLTQPTFQNNSRSNSSSIRDYFISDLKNPDPTDGPPSFKDLCSALQTINKDTSVSRIPVPITAQQPNTDTFDLTFSGISLESCNQKSIKRVDIYSPEYYLGKKSLAPISCEKPNLAGETTTSASGPSSDDQQVLKVLNLSPRNNSYSNRFLYGESSNLKRPFSKNNHSIKDLTIKRKSPKGDSCTKRFHSKHFSTLGMSNKAPRLEFLKRHSERFRYHPVGSNNSSNYSPSKRYNGNLTKTRKGQLRSMSSPINKDLPECKVDQLKVPHGHGTSSFVEPYTELFRENLNTNPSSRNDDDKDESVVISPGNDEQVKINNNVTVEFGIGAASSQSNNVGNCDVALETPSKVLTAINQDVDEDLGKPNVYKTDITPPNQPSTGKEMSKPTQDSGYETIATDIGNTLNDSMLTHTGDNLDVNDLMDDLSKPGASLSLSTCLSSPELAEINLMSSDSAQDTLPPSASDDNSLWSWDRSHTDKLPEIETNNQLLGTKTLSQSDQYFTPESEEQCSSNKTGTNYASPKMAFNKSRTAVSNQLIEYIPRSGIIHSVDDVDSNLSSHERNTVDPSSQCSTSPYTYGLADTFIGYMGCSSPKSENDKNEVHAVATKNDNQYLPGKDIDELLPELSDNSEFKYLFKTISVNDTASLDDGLNNYECTSEDSSLDLLVSEEISTTNLTLEVPKRCFENEKYIGEKLKDSMSSPLNNTTCKIHKSEDLQWSLIRKNKEIDSKLNVSIDQTYDLLNEGNDCSLNRSFDFMKTELDITGEQTKSPSAMSIDRFNFSSYSKFNRAQELTVDDKLKQNRAKTPIIPKRGVPFAELLKRF